MKYRQAGKIMIHALRRLGIAFGSLVAAWLAVNLVESLLGSTGLVSVVAIVLGALVYQDIIRREHRAT